MHILWPVNYSYQVIESAEGGEWPSNLFREYYVAGLGLEHPTPGFAVKLAADDAREPGEWIGYVTINMLKHIRFL